MSDFDNLPVPAETSPYYGGQEAKMCNVPTLKVRLETAVRQAEEKLAAVKRAKEIFDKHPDLEEILNIMQRSHF